MASVSRCVAGAVASSPSSLSSSSFSPFSSSSVALAFTEPAHLQVQGQQLHPTPILAAVKRRFPSRLASPAFFFSNSGSRLRLSSSNDRHAAFSSAHSDLDIISVKELSDGFLLFSFGVPANSSHSSSSSGQHVAAQLEFPKRLPSKFVKRSPIPATTTRRRRKKENSGALKDVAPPSQVATKHQSRPKSHFVKNSPIPKERVIKTSQKNLPTKHGLENINSTHKDITGVLKGSLLSKRPVSHFVKRSPIPEGRKNLRSVSSSAMIDNGSAVPVVDHSISAVSRPRSKFIRKTPIVRSSIGPVQDSITLKEEGIQAAYDLDKLKLAELKNLAKLKGLRGYSKLRKKELLDLLRSYDAPSN